MTYNPYYSQNYFPQQQIQPQQSQPQNGGFIPVPSEDVARNYPVAPGNSVTFKNENAPYVYTKTMGFSQLDRPIFEKYKLVREEDEPVSNKEMVTDDTIGELKEEIDSLWGEIDVLKEQISKRKRREDGGNRHDEQSE